MAKNRNELRFPVPVTTRRNYLLLKNKYGVKIGQKLSWHCSRLLTQWVNEAEAEHQRDEESDRRFEESTR